MSHPRRTAATAFVLGAALAIPAPMALAGRFDPPVHHKSTPEVSPADEASLIAASQPQGRRPSGNAERLAGWVTAADDNGDLPFMIVDKLGARIFAFDASGDFLGSAPVLIGLARGDDSAAGIGNLRLSQILADERTTPAGRFVSAFGETDGHGVVLWVDPGDGIALHPVMSVNPGEHRLQRIKSSNPKQHRISYGCINVPASFYDDVVLSALAGGEAVVYVLPDTKAMDEVFPAFAAALGGEEESPRQEISRASRPFSARALIPDPASPGLGPVDEHAWRQLSPP
ncbi:MAG TPA: L,D-transpeptidase [Caulobacteraceae bacterium]|nr:L,D-transpeptidase [Caulobacteraceae bacterium]